MCSFARPMGSRKIELFSGHPAFYGLADVEAAEHVSPSRQVTSEPWDGERGNLLLQGAICTRKSAPNGPHRRQLTCC